MGWTMWKRRIVGDEKVEEVEISPTGDEVVQVLKSRLERTKTVQLFGFLSRCCAVLEGLNTEEAIDVEYAPDHTNNSMAVCTMYDRRKTRFRREWKTDLWEETRDEERRALRTLRSFDISGFFFSRLRFADRLCR